MVDVVVNKGALRSGDRLFDRLQLLSEVQTRAPGFDHLDDAAEVAFRTSQPLHNIWVCGMERLICHMYILSWGRGYVKRHACRSRRQPSTSIHLHQCGCERLCRNDRSPAIFTRRLARVQRVFCLYTAYLLVELQFLRYTRLDSANM